jgi:hypothetical protein
MDSNTGIALAKEDTNDRIQTLPTLMNSSPDKKCPMVGAVVGVILGLALGILQLMYIGSWEFVYWAYMPMIPLYSALGWALFGMTIGGSGLFNIKTPGLKQSKLHPSSINTSRMQRTHF